MSPNPQFPGDLVTITEEILNAKQHLLGSPGNEKSLPRSDKILLLPNFLRIIDIILPNIPQNLMDHRVLQQAMVVLWEHKLLLVLW